MTILLGPNRLTRSEEERVVTGHFGGRILVIGGDSGTIHVEVCPQALPQSIFMLAGPGETSSLQSSPSKQHCPLL
jgi:hypothetical protein